MGLSIEHAELVNAVEQVTEYLSDERADYEAMIHGGAKAEHHIYHAVQMLEEWLDLQRHHRHEHPGPLEPQFVAVKHTLGRKYGHGDLRFSGTKQACEAHRAQYFLGGDYSVHIFRWEGDERPLLGTNVFINGEIAKEIDLSQTYLCIHVNHRIDHDRMQVATVLSVHRNPEEALQYWISIDPDIRPRPWKNEIGEPTYWVVHWNQSEQPKLGQEFTLNELERREPHDCNQSVILERTDLNLNELPRNEPVETHVVVKVESSGAWLLFELPDRFQAEVQQEMYLHREVQQRHYRPELRVCKWIDSQAPPANGLVHIDGEYAAGSLELDVEPEIQEPEIQR